ncbi:MAG: HEPN domain-containing protein [Nitrososphaeria archaeon]|nr:HEPN domain-containing protein [Nitrososphaeria archaeon]
MLKNFLGAALDLYKTGRWSKVCFNSQQAAELALKTALNYYGIEKRTHSLVDLLDEIVKVNKEFKAYEEAAKILDQYYIRLGMRMPLQADLRNDILQKIRLSRL